MPENGDEKTEKPDKCQMWDSCHSPPKTIFERLGVWVCTGCKNEYLKLKGS